LFLFCRGLTYQNCDIDLCQGSVSQTSQEASQHRKDDGPHLLAYKLETCVFQSSKFRARAKIKASNELVYNPPVTSGHLNKQSAGNKEKGEPAQHQQDPPKQPGSKILFPRQTSILRPF
jgi:hypothetical protein